MSNPLPTLQPGDIMLYAGSGFVDWAIKLRTWSDVDHIEVYLGNQQSTASRNGIGVNTYPFRRDGLKYVRRPLGIFDLDAATKYADAMKGTPYGYGDLGRFYLLNIPTKGVICSQYGDLLFDAAGTVLFAEDYPAGSISPRDYRVTPLAKTIWTA